MGFKQTTNNHNLTVARWRSRLLVSLSCCGFFVAGAAGPLVVSARAETFSAIPIFAEKSGDGCPPGDARAVFNGDTLSLIFSSFEAKTGDATVVHKSCNIIATAMIPAGVRIQPVRVNYIGSASVPLGGTASIVFNAFVHDQLFAAQNRVFSSGFNGNFEASLQASPQVIDACSGPVPTVFALNTNLVAVSFFSLGPRTPTQIRIDTTDVVNGAIIKIAFVALPCTP